MTCDAPECHRQVRNGARGPRRYCEAHRQRLLRRQSLDLEIVPRHQTPRERLIEAVLLYLELKPTDSDAWGRAWDRLRKAATDYAAKAKPGRPREQRRISEP